jgi:hypothetical protein
MVPSVRPAARWFANVRRHSSRPSLASVTLIWLAYIHGMNGIAEGVRQLRGTSVNPVPDVEHVLVTAGTGVPTSGLILG